MHIKGHKLGLVVGGFLGLVHLMWSVLVALGWAQPLLHIILRLHFMYPSPTVANFDLTTAIALVVVTSVIGYVVGRVIALLWNWASK